MSLQTSLPSQTGSDTAYSPTETKPDFTTDVPPLVEISAEQFLQDEQRMKKLMARFCDAIYAHAVQDTIDGIIDESLRLCGGSRQILSTVLQTKFFLGHTPFYWAIVNKDPNHAGIPLLLEKLFSVCGNTVDATTEEEIIMTLLLLEDPGDDLYQSIEPRLETLRHPSTPSYFRGEGQQPTVKGIYHEGLLMRATAEFRIPLFFDRLALEKEVCLTFIAMGSLWRLRAAVDIFPNPSLRECAWHLELTETKSRHSYSLSQKYRRKVSINLAHSTGGQPPLQCSATQEISKPLSTITISISDASLRRFRHNPYTSTQTRELSGTLEITDTRMN